MRALTLSVLAFLLSLPAFADNTRDVRSKITDVTVYLTGAQITRKSEVTLEPGRTTLSFSGLSALMDGSTAVILGDGDFTILSVNTRTDFLTEKEDDPRVKKLRDSLNAVVTRIQDIDVQYSIIRNEESFLNQSRRFPTGNDHIDPDKFIKMNEYVSDKFGQLQIKKLALVRERQELMKKQYKYQNQMRAIQNPVREEVSVLDVMVETDKRISAKIILKYIVSGAGWTPAYDVRVGDLSKSLEMVYKAEIAQNTGVDWENVKLNLSNGNPYENSTVPTLNPYYLGFVSASSYQAKYNAIYNAAVTNMAAVQEKEVRGQVLDANTGEPLIGALVTIPGQGTGAITDMDGRYKLSVPSNQGSVQISYLGYNTQNVATNEWETIMYLQPQAMKLEEIVREEEINVRSLDREEIMMIPEREMNINSSTQSLGFLGARTAGKRRFYKNSSGSYAELKKAGYSSANPIQNQTSIEFEVKEAYTFPSNGKKKMINLQTREIPANYEYRAVPKIEESAFLIAQIVDWSQYDLMPGSVNLYLDNKYVGKTNLDVYYVSDTLDISLGKDKSVVIQREKVRESSGREFIGTDRVDKREFEIKCQNNKKTPIRIVIFDQVPVSQINTITVEVKETSGASVEERTGLMRKELRIDPGQNQSFSFRYVVKYPKGQNINLE